MNLSHRASALLDKDGVEHGASADPMSHRIIEKRRRDRMNNCLADLSRLIPAEYLKKGRGRIEKTEIIEMAIRHMKHLQAHACRHAGVPVRGMHFMVGGGRLLPGDPLCVQLINHLQRHRERILKVSASPALSCECRTRQTSGPTWRRGSPLPVFRDSLFRSTRWARRRPGSTSRAPHLGDERPARRQLVWSGAAGPLAEAAAARGGSGGGGLGSSGLGSASAVRLGLRGRRRAHLQATLGARTRDRRGRGRRRPAALAGPAAPRAPGLALAARHDDCYEEGAPAPAPPPAPRPRPPRPRQQLRDMLTKTPRSLWLRWQAAEGWRRARPQPGAARPSSQNGSAPPLPTLVTSPPASPGPAPTAPPGRALTSSRKNQDSASPRSTTTPARAGPGGGVRLAPRAPKAARYASDEDGPGAAAQPC
ncbi:Transcription factor cwo [Gryllus bimaculatus]|nr:Transcription factor cwo [Gryllus bimaculatus]